MNLPGRPVAAFDPEGLIFAAGISSESLKLYDLRSFDKVWNSGLFPERFAGLWKVSVSLLNVPMSISACDFVCVWL